LHLGADQLYPEVFTTSLKTTSEAEAEAAEQGVGVFATALKGSKNY